MYVPSITDFYTKPVPINRFPSADPFYHWRKTDVGQPVCLFALESCDTSQAWKLDGGVVSLLVPSGMVVESVTSMRLG